MKLSIASFLLFFISFGLQSQDCEVKIAELQGEYKGKCKKGSAHGKGKAVGADTYEGTFKRGYPDGNGVYTFANGNVYTGEFKKGLKVGKGVMTFNNEDIPTLDGYWIDDEYAGKDKKVYNIIDQSTSIRSVKFRRIDGKTDKIVFRFASQGKPVRSRGVVFETPVAAEINTTEFLAEYTISEFPFKGNLRFEAAALKNANGSPDFVEGQFEFELKFKGNWEVTVEMNTNE